MNTNSTRSRIKKANMTPSQRKFTAADLITGKNYKVTKTFKDYDGITHAVGESWRMRMDCHCMLKAMGKMCPYACSGGKRLKVRSSTIFLTSWKKSDTVKIMADAKTIDFPNW